MHGKQKVTEYTVVVYVDRKGGGVGGGRGEAGGRIETGCIGA